VAQRYRVVNGSESWLGIPTDDGEGAHIAPGRAGIVSARQLLDIRRTALYKAGKIAVSPEQEEEERVGQLLALDAKALGAAIKGETDTRFLEELEVASLDRGLPKMMANVINKRRDELDIVVLADDEGEAPTPKGRRGAQKRVARTAA